MSGAATGGAGALHMRVTAPVDRSAAGVFVAVTTVPAAAFASVALVEDRHMQATQSAAQLAIDLGGTVVAVVAVLLVSRSRSRRGRRKLSAG